MGIRKPLSEVSAKEGVQTLIGIDAQKFADHLHRKHFAIEELGLRTTPSNAFAFEPIVNQTVHTDQVGGTKVKTSIPCVGMGATFVTVGFFDCQAARKTCTSG